MTEQPEIITLPIKDIRPYWRNPRNNREAVPKVKASIEKYGYNQLIAVDPQHVIIVGHTRYLALVALGWTEAQVMVLNLDDKKAKAYRIADNKTHEFSSWTPDLIPELKELGDLDEMQFFFKDDLSKLVGASVGQDHKEVTAEEVAAATAKAQERFGEDHKKAAIETTCPQCGHVFSIAK